MVLEDKIKDESMEAVIATNNLYWNFHLGHLRKEGKEVRVEMGIEHGILVGKQIVDGHYEGVGSLIDLDNVEFAASTVDNSDVGVVVPDPT